MFVVCSFVVCSCYRALEPQTTNHKLQTYYFVAISTPIDNALDPVPWERPIKKIV
jgi:hypothetical protein